MNDVIGGFVQRRTRIWIGLGSTLLVGGTNAADLAMAREAPVVGAVKRNSDFSASATPRILMAQAEASGEGGPGEGGGQVLGTITEFRLSSNDPNAFSYDATSQVSAYAELVFKTYEAAQSAAAVLKDAVVALQESPSAEKLEAARTAWLDARAAYLKTEAFLFYAGPVDGPGGPLPRLNAWPVDPMVIDGLLADPSQSLGFRSLAQLNRVEPPVNVTTGLHVLEYLLWGTEEGVSAETFASQPRRGEYAASAAQLLANDLGFLTSAWTPGANNYRASVETMDQRNALGRAFNGMTVLVGYEIPLRRIGAGLFPANKNFQPSPYSGTSELDNRYAFEGAKQVYFGTGIDRLVKAVDEALAAKIAAGFERAEAALRAMDAPYERFLAPASGSPERATADAAARALTDLARDLRQAGNRLGVLVVVPGM